MLSGFPKFTDCRINGPRSIHSLRVICFRRIPCLKVKPMDNRDDLKQRLSPEQYRVACQCGTEPPFDNEFWDNKEPGIYVDIISGEPLFFVAGKVRFRHRLAEFL